VNCLSYKKQIFQHAKFKYLSPVILYIGIGLSFTKQGIRTPIMNTEDNKATELVDTQAKVWKRLSTRKKKRMRNLDGLTKQY
jgi:hypothetical protein